MSEALVGSLALAGAGLVLLVLAWLIGVQGMVELVNNYRANPDRFPDREGLARWMALTLAGGGASFLVCAGAFAGGYVSENLFGMWTATTGIARAPATARWRGPGAHAVRGVGADGDAARLAPDPHRIVAVRGRRLFERLRLG